MLLLLIFNWTDAGKVIFREQEELQFARQPPTIKAHIMESLAITLQIVTDPVS